MLLRKANDELIWASVKARLGFFKDALKRAVEQPGAAADVHTFTVLR